MGPQRGEIRGTAVTTGSLLERESSLGIILMLPGAFLLMVFMAYPFFLGIWLSLTDSVIGRGWATSSASGTSWTC